jgi:hypothetical protein
MDVDLGFRRSKAQSSSLTHAVISIAADTVTRRRSPHIVFTSLQAPRLPRDIITPRRQPVNIRNGQRHSEWFYWGIRKKIVPVYLWVVSEMSLDGKFLPFLLGNGRDNRHLRCSFLNKHSGFMKADTLETNLCNFN